MKQHASILHLLPYLFFLCLLAACGSGGNDKKEQPEVKSTKKDTPAVVEKKVETPAKRPPIINITDTVSVKQTILCMKDSAASFERISLKLGAIYGAKLGAVLKKTGMKMAGPPMAWYRTQKAPYYFEAGIPVDKKQGKIPANCYFKQTGTDSVTVAHFYGPYDLLPDAYDALKDLMKDRKKKAKEPVYEIYVGDPVDKDGKMKDPYKVQTDVVFTWR
jgi:effector-binding domain-containing protein